MMQMGRPHRCKLPVAVAAAVIAAAALTVSGAAAQDQAGDMPSPPSSCGLISACEVHFTLATDTIPASKPQLINSAQVTVRTADWPTIIVATMHGKDNSGNAVSISCTGSIVGPGIMLLAAHCLDLRSSVLRTSYIDLANTPRVLSCEVDDAYLKPPADPDPDKPRRSEDFALCHTDPALLASVMGKVPFERVSILPLPAHAKVLMMGFGCTDLEAGDQGTTLRLGDGYTSTAAHDAPNGAYAKILSSAAPEPALCPGDSGGPLFTGATTIDQTKLRRIRGVNSKVERQDRTLVSSISMLSDPSFIAWAKEWLAKYPGAYICGIDPDSVGSNCRV